MTGPLLLEGAPPSVTLTRRTNSSFNVTARAVETAGALRRLGYTPDEVKAAVDATRAHVGTCDLPGEQWIKIAEQCPRPASSVRADRAEQKTGDNHVSGLGTGFAVAPRIGANFMVGRSAVLTPSLSYQYTSIETDMMVRAM